MQQLDMFGNMDSGTRPTKPKVSKPVEAKHKVVEKKVSSVMTNPMGTEMVVNDQIKVKIKQIKSALSERKNESIDNVDLIEKIKAKLKKEFDLSTPVERNDDDYKKKNGRQKKEANGIESFAAPINIPADEELFKKQYYTMGQVSEMFQVNQSMLRFWESEFDIIKPKKNKKGDRYFRPVDIKNLELIYHLIRIRKFSIEGAKAFLKQHKQRAIHTFSAVQSLEKIKLFLIDIKKNL